MNSLDKQYQALLQDILDNGVTKSDRTGTGTISVFGRQIRHKMSDGFPLLTTKKMPFKTIVTELLWFLRGDTNIKFLVDNGCHIWDGDAYKNYEKIVKRSIDKATEDGILRESNDYNLLSKETFIERIKTDDKFAKKWGDLGPIYGKQWRSWEITKTTKLHNNPSNIFPGNKEVTFGYVDQIQNLINDLKTNPDSRRLMVNAWNVGELDQMVLPPCHYGFQVYTRELSESERIKTFEPHVTLNTHQECDNIGLPKRAISLMWNQRSVDTFLGLPFNIASYGLLLEIIAKAVNMVPDELIGNLGDVHLYSNHIEQAKEQIGRKYDHEERHAMLKEAMGPGAYQSAIAELMPFGGGLSEYYDAHKIPYRTREPYQLPSLNINTEFWARETEYGPLDAVSVFNNFTDDNFCKCLLEEDIQLANYQSHPTIKAPLSN
ncbi:ThyA Thymidylate synthase [uncultured Caudovirales phage]|uniref:thymidylate synthase n=1 Tax=uncultured Caudovirales phage TaxID=2100421 RepID=A0A6J5SV69_9CAUD|nr:ThyA Thymidylate synthase [uncultured Caudovirales phage]